jgi:uncharacterized membrane protein
MRLTEVDALRGVAITMMVAYHIIFDINYFGIAPVDLYSLPLVLFQRVTGSLFLLLVGVSLTLSESRNKEGYMRHLRRGLWFGAVALCITAATWVFPHEGFITFGIIHLIALSTLIAPFFFRFGRLNAVIGLLAIAIGMMMVGVQTDSHYLFWLGLTYPGYTALDYYPLLPWFGVILMGMAAGGIAFPSGKPALSAPWKDTIVAKGLAFLGRNSLAIYLAHQPLIVGAVFALKALGAI